MVPLPIRDISRYLSRNYCLITRGKEIIIKKLNEMCMLCGHNLLVVEKFSVGSMHNNPHSLMRL